MSEKEDSPNTPTIVSHRSTPPIGIIPNPSTPTERILTRGWDIVLCLIPAYLLFHGKIPVSYGALLIGLLGGPPELVRQIIKLMRVVNERTSGRGGVAGSTAAGAASALAIVLTYYTQAKTVGGAIAIAAVLAGACTSCIPWDREPCTVPNTWECQRNQPHFCSTEAAPKWTPIGDRPCAYVRATCTMNAETGRAYCRPDVRPE